MIRLFKANKESRKRDKKRGRWVLAIGERSIHLDKKEVRQLKKALHK